MTIPAPFFLYLLVYLMAWAGISVAQADDYACFETGETTVWISPLAPKADAPIKIMAVSTESPLTELALIDSQGRRRPIQYRLRGGPPWTLIAALEALNEGDYRIVAGRNGEQTACHPLSIGRSGEQESAKVWGLATEAFYSAWIEELFGAPLKEVLRFHSLDPVIQNKERNFLHSYLGLNEEDGLSLTPDCADLPYTLRAYFAWKVGLPIAFRDCGRGSTEAPPQCEGAMIKTEFTQPLRSQDTFRNVCRELVNVVHSGAVRTGLEDEGTDLYPIPLSRETLWPGTVFADPYGHVLVLVEWLPQRADRPGILLGVDAQPDSTVTRKPFWEGSFQFAAIQGAGPGFKAFRPLVRKPSGEWRVLANGELIDNPGFAPFSLEQDQLSPDDFYARMTKLMNPSGLIYPKQTYEATLNALIEQIEARVTSVNNGEAYLRNNPGSIIPMPDGAAIFQTLGPWEDYATPARDMRLLIAMNVLNGLPHKIVRYPELFVLKDQRPEAVMEEIEQHHRKLIKERSIRYTRSDGSLWALTVDEVLARKPDFEMAYNPNDCPEIRWGAKPGTEEYSTCHRHSPAEQRDKMEQYRIWFREVRRPA